MFGRVVSCVDPITGEVGKQPETLAGPVPGMVNKVELDCDIDYKVVLTNGAAGDGTIGQAQNSMTYNPSCVVGTDEFGEDIVKGVLKVDCIKAESIEGSECAKYLYQNEIDCDVDYDLPIWKDDKNAQCFTSMATSSAYPITFNPNKGLLCVNEIEADLPSIGCHSDVTLTDPVAPYSVLRYNCSTEKFESVQQVAALYDVGNTTNAPFVFATGTCCQQLVRTSCIALTRSYTGVASCTIVELQAIPPALNTSSVAYVNICATDKNSNATLYTGNGCYYGGASFRAWTCSESAALSYQYNYAQMMACYKANGPELAGMKVQVCPKGAYIMHYGCSQYQPANMDCNFAEGYRFVVASDCKCVNFEKYNGCTLTWDCAIPSVETIQTINYASNWSCMTNYIASNPHTGKWLPVNILCTGNSNAYMGFTVCDYSVNCSKCICGTNIEGVIFYHNANSAVGIFHACMCGARRQVVVHRHYTGAETVTVTPALGTFLGEASTCVINVKCVL